MWLLQPVRGLETFALALLVNSSYPAVFVCHIENFLYKIPIV